MPGLFPLLICLLIKNISSNISCVLKTIFSNSSSVLNGVDKRILVSCLVFQNKFAIFTLPLFLYMNVSYCQENHLFDTYGIGKVGVS
jgi:hypothetical protein